MKEIKAVIGHLRLTPLHDALRAVPGFPGMTVSRAESYPPASHKERSTIREELTDHFRRWRVEMVVPDEVAAQLYDAVVTSVSGGAPGESLVWMSDVERASFVRKHG
jgi:nitrogen regulatory protein P-II 1